MEIKGLPDKIGVYTVIKPDGKVKLMVVYFNKQLGCLYVASNIGEYGHAALHLFKDANYRWFGPLELPAEPLSRLDENFLY